MGKKLVIAEKPSVAHDIARALGGFRDEGEYLESDDCVVSWASGHLLELAEPDEYGEKYKRWTFGSPENPTLPILPASFRTVAKERQEKRLAILGDLARREDVDVLVNACDAGREGELIFRRIAEHLGIAGMPTRRLWLRSMTKDAIRTGFRDLRDARDLDPLGDAAWARAIGDWLIGMNVTRSLTLRLGKKGGLVKEPPWTAGRVQTPTLKMLVDREREILAHVPRPYWEVAATFSLGDTTWEASFWDPAAPEEPEEGRKPGWIFERSDVDALMAALKPGVGGTATEKRKSSQQNPPLPFDLTTLQREANRRFSFSAKRTLDAAQRLYEEHKVLTYPRTDSRHLPSDYGPVVSEVLAGLRGEGEIGLLAGRILDQGPLNLAALLDSSKVSDHFAIVPTGQAPEGKLKRDDEKIYDLVLRQFLASLMGPARWIAVERIVAVRVRGSDARFRTTSRTLEIKGFLEAFGRDTGSSEDLAPLPATGKDGVAVELVEAREQACETKPPPRHSEATLLRMMETAGTYVEDEELSDAMKERGIGTPATRADIIENLVKREYARRIDGRIAPSARAMILFDLLDRVVEHLDRRAFHLVAKNVRVLASPRLTGEWERELMRVESGALTRAEMHDRLVSYTKGIVAGLRGFDREALYPKADPLGACPECAAVGRTGWVYEGFRGYSCEHNAKAWNGGDRTAAPDCRFTIWKDRNGLFVHRALAERLIAAPETRIGPISGFADRYGRSVEGTLFLARKASEKEGMEPSYVLKAEFGGERVAPGAEDAVAEEITGVLCPNPLDPADEIVETNLRWVSRKVLDGGTRSGPVLPRVVCEREIAKEEALGYFSESGRTDVLDGFLSKKRRPFRGALVRKPNGKHEFDFPPREAGEGARSGRKRGRPKRASSEPDLGTGETR